MPDIGFYALRFALVVGVAGIAVGVFAGITRRSDWTRVSERAVYVVFGFLTLGMLALFYGLGTNDFSLSYVARHSARTMPLHYRLGALWGGQAGSLMLWAWLLLAYGSAAVFANRRSNRALMPWVAACLLLNATFFLVLLNFATNPFERLPYDQILSDGDGLNPLLQHPVMMIHPLMLYLGFTGFAVPFAFALGALLSGELGTSWFRTTRRWSLFAWLALGSGVVLGGRWAYEVLGWGGYWAWDPVENASLMPLARRHGLPALGDDPGEAQHAAHLERGADRPHLHDVPLRNVPDAQRHRAVRARVHRRRLVQARLPQLRGRDGRNLLRSGDLSAPRALEPQQARVRRVSREASFLINNWVFMVLLAVVFGFTMLPVFSESLSGSRMTLGPDFFNVVTGPLALILLLLTGIGPMIAWRRASPSSLRATLPGRPPSSDLVSGGALAALFWGRIGYWTVLCWTLSAFVTATIMQEYWEAIAARRRSRGESTIAAFGSLLRKNQRRYGGYIVHLGVVVMMLGISGSVFNQELLENLQPGDSMQVQKYRLEYLTAEPITQQHYGGATARIALYQGDRGLATMAPEKRMYWLEQQPSSIPRSTRRSWKTST